MLLKSVPLYCCCKLCPEKPNSFQTLRIQVCKRFFLTSVRCLKLIRDFHVCGAQAIGFSSSHLAVAGKQPYVANVNDTKWKGKLNGCQLLFGWQQLVTTLGISQACRLTLACVGIHHRVNETINPFSLCLHLTKTPQNLACTRISLQLLEKVTNIKEFHRVSSLELISQRGWLSMWLNDMIPLQGQLVFPQKVTCSFNLLLICWHIYLWALLQCVLLRLLLFLMDHIFSHITWSSVHSPWGYTLSEIKINTSSRGHVILVLCWVRFKIALICSCSCTCSYFWIPKLFKLFGNSRHIAIVEEYSIPVLLVQLWPT